LFSCPLRHGACNKPRKPRAFATASRTESRRRAIKPRHGFARFFTAVPPAPTFAAACIHCALRAYFHVPKHSGGFLSISPHSRKPDNFSLQVLSYLIDPMLIFGGIRIA
jgi:hypothetical protein